MTVHTTLLAPAVYNHASSSNDPDASVSSVFIIITFLIITVSYAREASVALILLQIILTLPL